MKSLTKNPKIKLICQNLIKFIDDGTHTPLPNKIKKIRKKLDNRQLTYAQLDNLLLAIGKKYNADKEEIPPRNETINQELDLDISPEIVITETFIK